MNFRQMNFMEAGTLQPVANLERLPEMLVNSLIAEIAEREIVEVVFGVMGRVLPRFRFRHSRSPRLILQQHRKIMDAIHRWHDTQETAVRLEDIVNRRQRFFQLPISGRTRLFTDTATIYRPSSDSSSSKARCRNSTLGKLAFGALGQHPLGEIDRNHTMKAFSQERQQGTDAAAKVATVCLAVSGNSASVCRSGLRTSGKYGSMKSFSYPFAARLQC